MCISNLKAKASIADYEAFEMIKIIMAEKMKLANILLQL